MQRVGLVLLALLALCIAGCGPRWSRSDLAPNVAKERLDRDDALCQQRADQVLPPLTGNEREMSATPLRAEAADWSFDYDRDKIYDECMQSLGWNRK
jgi:hypothetical protein